MSKTAKRNGFRPLTLKKSPLKPMSNNCPNCGSSNTKWHSEGYSLTCYDCKSDIYTEPDGSLLAVFPIPLGFDLSSDESEVYDGQSDLYTEVNGSLRAVRPHSPDDESATDAHSASSLDSLILSLADLERRISNSLESLTIEQMDALNASVQTFTHTVRYQLQVTAGQKEIKQS